MQLTPDAKKEQEEEERQEEVVTVAPKKPEVGRATAEDPPDSFFDLVIRYQSARMDDQRTALNANKENVPKPKPSANKMQRSASSGPRTTK